MTEQQTNGAWHLDRTINMSVVFAMLLQAAGVIWWVSGVSNRVDTATATNEEQDARILAVEAVSNAQAVSAATLTAQLTAMRDSLQELKASQSETNRLLRDLTTNGVKP